MTCVRICELKAVLPCPQDHWLPGFNFNVEEWDAQGLHYGTLAIWRSLEPARTAFAAAVEEKPAGRSTAFTTLGNFGLGLARAGWSDHIYYTGCFRLAARLRWVAFALDLRKI